MVTSFFTLAAEEAEEHLKGVGGGGLAVMRVRRGGLLGGGVG